jgi:hypothetical protein
MNVFYDGNLCVQELREKKWQFQELLRNIGRKIMFEFKQNKLK